MECNTFYNINDAIADMNALREENWEPEALLDFGVQSNVRAHARKGPCHIIGSSSSSLMSFQVLSVFIL